MFVERNWNKCHIVSDIKGFDFIVENVLIDNPDFGDLDTLTFKIEERTLEFIKDIENFLAKI